MKNLIKSTLRITAVLFLTLISSHVFGTESLKIIKNQKTIIAPKAESYTWYFNGVKMVGVTGNSAKILKQGKYSVTMTTPEGNQVHKEIVVSTKSGTTPIIYIIGDSTASIYGANSYPRTGWGQVLQPFLDTSNILVDDRALSGRSSKSYYTDANGWPAVSTLLSEGDYLFIQFGHNDQKNDERYTEPFTTYQEYLSKYIDSARALGANPVLLTSIHRNGWSGDLINDSHGDYPPAMRELALEKDVPLIDLHEKTKTYLESVGEEYSTNQVFNNLEAGVWPNYPSGNEDNTHLQENGAYQVCKLIVEGIEEIKDSVEITPIYNALIEAGRVVSMASPNLSGTISGAGIYPIGSEVTLTANPKPGFVFINWTEDGSIIDNSGTISFTLDSELRTVTPNFEKAYEVILKQTPSFKATLDGGGYYLAGSEVTIIATPKDGYRFLYWEQNDATVSTDSSYTFTISEEDVTFRAYLEALPTSSTDKNKSDVSVLLYPNPSNGEFLIRANDHILKVEILNLSGQVVFQQEYYDKEVSLSPEIYSENKFVLVRITTTKGQTVKKVNLL